jgi:hypothetical protein
MNVFFSETTHIIDLIELIMYIHDQ